MKQFFDFRILRKIAVLLTLVGGIYFLSSDNLQQNLAAMCCSDCEEQIATCAEFCNSAYPNSPQEYYDCYKENCLPAERCRRFCVHGTPGQGCGCPPGGC